MLNRRNFLKAAGLSLVSADYVEIVDCDVRSNEAEYSGGGFQASNSEFDIEDSSIAAILDVPPLPFFGGVFDLGCRGGSGMTLERLASRGRPLAVDVYGTVARVELPEPLAPGGTFRFEISWHWTIPEYGYARTDREGTLWVGVFGGGLNRAAAGDYSRFARYSHNPEDASSLASDRVIALHSDRTNNLWVGMEGGGLNRFVQ